MALGFLFLWFVGMSILAIVGAVLLFLIKKNNATNVLLVSMAAYSMFIAYRKASAVSVDLISAQVLAWVIGLVAVIGAGIYLLTKKQLVTSKVLVVSSVFAGIFFLYFG